MSLPIIDEILKKADIVEVISEFINISKVGKNYKGICTIHNDTTPSLSISQEKQIFKCFSCGIAGNTITFLEKFQNMSKKDAIVFLAKKYDINYNNFIYIENSRYSENQKKIIKVFEDITKKFSYDLTFNENEKAILFLKERHIDKKIQEKFEIGYAKASNIENYKFFLLKKNNDISTMINASLINEKENQTISDKIIFPIKNEFGDLVAISARSLDSNEKTYKYINSGESIVFNKSNIIYNYWRAKDIGKEVYLVEGFMDVIAFSRIGLDNAIALMGTSISKFHIDKLKSKSIILFYDNDQAGIKATLKSIFFFLQANNNIDIIMNDSNYDPDEYLNKFGEIKFKELLSNKISGIEYIYQYLIKSIDLNNSNNIVNFISKFNKYLVFCNSLIKSQYSYKISQLLNIDINKINESLNLNLNNLKNEDKKIIYNNIEIKSEKTNRIKDTFIFINRLLLGMLENSELIQIYLSKNVFLGKMEYIELATYIINKKNNDINFQINEDLEKKLELIKKTPNPPKNKEEFLETIRNIEYEKINIKLDQNSKKIQKTISKNPDDDFIMKILQNSIETKKIEK